MMSSPSRKREIPAPRQPDFASTLKKYAAPLPPALVRKLGRQGESPLGKVKVMLKVCDGGEDVNGSGTGILGVDQRKKQVTLIDPGGNNSGPSGITPEERRVGVSAPKMFAFDGLFGEDDDQAEICAAAGAELVASVVGGEDGCFVSLGYCSGGKKQTMFGRPTNQKLGVIPSVISWLYRSIHEQRQKTGARFSVRVSAVEVTGGSGHESIKDLLERFAIAGDQPPGAYLLESGGGVNGKSFSSSSPPILSSMSEVRAPNPETAGSYLDAALEAMSKEDPVRHFVYTLHIYQYAVDKNGKGAGVGGRSRLHCVMLGNGSPSLSVLGGLLLAVLNGQRHLPSRDSKLGAILRECLGSLTCRAVVMIHVSSAHAKYAETLAALQLASRVHRLRRSRRFKMGSVSSGTGSGGSSGGSGEEMRMNSCSSVLGLGIGGGLNASLGCVGEGETGNSDIDPSSSEQSCDTVIYLGPSMDDATDGEHPPVYLPSLENGSGDNSVSVSGKSNGQLNGVPPPKTKSPKPKSAKIDTAPSSGAYNGGKAEEKWVDGPKIKYKHGSNGGSSNGRMSADSGGKKSETWIDGPAARVMHQGSNFPSPKKSLQSHNSSSKVQRGTSSAIPSLDSAGTGMSLTKAEMIQKWISNQTHPNFLEELHGPGGGGGNKGGSERESSGSSLVNSKDVSSSSPFSPLNGTSGLPGSGMPPAPSSSPHPFSKFSNHQYGVTGGGNRDSQKHYYNLAHNSSSSPHHRISLRNGGGSGNYYGVYSPGHPGTLLESEYKALTVFKTCEEKKQEKENICLGLVGNGNEMIEALHPEPVVSRDAWLQVTEEDIALSLMDLEENLLPESDQNLRINSNKGYLASQKGSYSLSRERANSLRSEIKALQQANDHQIIMHPEKNQDHPLRVLSEECLTVVSTFTADSVSAKGGQLDRFWPRLSFQEATFDPDDDADHEDMHMCSGLCKNLGSLSQMSLNRAHLLYTERQRTEYGKPAFRNEKGPVYPENRSPQSSPFHTIGPNHNQYQSTKIGSCYSLPKKLKPVVMPVPDLSDESIYKIPTTNLDEPGNNSKADMKSKDLSDTEQDAMSIPPMKLLDLTPIRSHNGSIASIPVSDSFENGDEIMARVSALISPEHERLASPAHTIHHIYESPQHHKVFHNNVNLVKMNGNANVALSPEVKTTVLQDQKPLLAKNAGAIPNSKETVLPSNVSQPILIDTPPSSPSTLPEITKSPSKSKSRKIAKFFRTRSKSPKTVVATTPNSSATSGSDSGKSSVSHSSLLSSNSTPKGKLSSSSSCSSGASSSSPGSTKIGSVIAISASKLSSPKKSAIPAPPAKATVNANAQSTKIPLPRNLQMGGSKGTDYHFTCDSNLPIFLPTPNTAA